MARPVSPAAVGRGQRARSRVQAAALEQLAEAGAAGFTMEAIARRAGASKATVYRHWSSPSALLVDAMRATFRPFPAPVTGDPREDLVTLLGMAADLLGGQRFPRLMAAVVDLAERDPALAGMHADLTESQRRPVLEVLARCQEQGTISAGADLELLVDLLTAPFFYRRLIAHYPIPPELARTVVDQVLPPR
jgi:AcrR family transcriptional regulator